MQTLYTNKELLSYNLECSFELLTNIENSCIIKNSLLSNIELLESQKLENLNLKKLVNDKNETIANLKENIEYYINQYNEYLEELLLNQDSHKIIEEIDYDPYEFELNNNNNDINSTFLNNIVKKLISINSDLKEKDKLNTIELEINRNKIDKQDLEYKLYIDEILTELSDLKKDISNKQLLINSYIKENSILKENNVILKDKLQNIQTEHNKLIKNIELENFALNEDSEDLLVKKSDKNNCIDNLKNEIQILNNHLDDYEDNLKNYKETIIKKEKEELKFIGKIELLENENLLLIEKNKKIMKEFKKILENKDSVKANINNKDIVLKYESDILSLKKDLKLSKDLHSIQVDELFKRNTILEKKFTVLKEQYNKLKTNYKNINDSIINSSITNNNITNIEK